MKSEIFKMLKIYEQDFPEQMLEVTRTEVIAHYYQTLNRVNDNGISDSDNNCKEKCTKYQTSIHSSLYNL